MGGGKRAKRLFGSPWFSASAFCPLDYEMYPLRALVELTLLSDMAAMAATLGACGTQQVTERLAKAHQALASIVGESLECGDALSHTFAACVGRYLSLQSAGVAEVWGDYTMNILLKARADMRAVAGLDSKRWSSAREQRTGIMAWPVQSCNTIA